MSINTGLVGHWKFNEKSGIIANDSSRYRNTGTLTGASHLPIWSEGGLNFDGDSKYVALPEEIPQLGLTTNKTIMFEAALGRNGVDVGDIQSLIYLKSGIQLHYRGTTNSINFRFDNAEARIVDYAMGQDNFDMHQIVGTYSYNGVNSTLKLYVDGILRNSNIFDMLPEGYFENSIGRLGTSYYFNGTIYEVSIYNRALSPNEIKRHYRRYKHKYI